MPLGSSVRGAITRVRICSAPRSRRFERATRELAMSPQIATVRPSSRPMPLADGQRVEQRLRRVLVRAVAGVDHRAADLLAQELHRARRRVAHDDHVRPHRVERRRRVDQRLALGHRRGAHRHVHDLRAEPLAGDLERALGAGRGLEEEVDLGLAAQRRQRLPLLPADRDHRLGAVEQIEDFVGVEVGDGEQVALGKAGRWGRSGPWVRCWALVPPSAPVPLSARS